MSRIEDVCKVTVIDLLRLNLVLLLTSHLFIILKPIPVTSPSRLLLFDWASHIDMQRIIKTFRCDVRAGPLCLDKAPSRTDAAPERQHRSMRRRNVISMSLEESR
jgi:hypothetical protein